MLKKVISLSLIYQFLLIATNTISSIVITRDLSVINKSSQAYINLLCGAGIIIFNQNAIELRLRKVSGIKYSSMNFQSLIYILLGMFLFTELRTHYSVWVLTAFYFSLSLLNSSNLNEFFLLNGNVATQKLRLIYSCSFLILILAFHFFRWVSVTTWVIAFLVCEVCLSIFLRRQGNGQLQKNGFWDGPIIDIKRHASFRNLAAVCANLVETFVILILGIIGAPEMIAYLSVSFSIISVVTIPFVALQAPIISHSKNLFTKIRKNETYTLYICLFIFLVIAQFLLKDFYAKVTLFVFGPSYEILAEKSYLIVMAGLCSLFSRFLNSIFRGLGRARIALFAALSPAIVLIPLLALNLGTISETCIAMFSLTALPLAILLTSIKFLPVS